MIRRIRAETEQDIQQIEKSISRSQEAIGRLRAQKNTQSVILRYEKDIQSSKEKISELQIILNEIETGEYEEKLKSQLENNKKIIETKSKSTQKRKQQKLNQSQVKPTEQGGNATYNNYNNYTKFVNMDREEHYYLKDCKSLPNHLKDRLKKMPSDTGFIWKDIWCMGELPSRNRDSFPVTLHEKKDSKMLIHIYDRTKYSLYEKDENGRRHLIMTRSR
jgi:hypothetical protein